MQDAFSRIVLGKGSGAFLVGFEAHQNGLRTVIVTLGGALLGWIAGGMMVTDVATVDAIGEPSAALRYAASAAGAVLVVLIGKVLTARRRAAA